ncbi:MAG: FkbM family methyltransferase [Candidatus Omnitrophota bacterium]|jgi:FkbM family methyltransferase
MSFYQTAFYHKYVSCFATAIKTISRNIKNKKFEPEVAVLDRFLSEGMTVIDVGGAYGRYALPMARLIGSEGHVHSFEPGAYSFRVLSIVKAFHRLSNVTINNKALADKPGKLHLNAPFKRNGRVGPSLAYVSEKKEKDAYSEEVDVVTIGDYCKEQDITKVDFIKADVEGAEYGVFKGAEDIIKRDKPVVLSEVENDNLKRFNLTADDIQNFFKQYGYKTYYLDGKNLIECEKIEEPLNYFFIPEGKEFQKN